MNFKSISRNVGYALLVSALFMLISAFVSLADGGADTSFAPLMVSFLITFIVGVFPMIFVRKTPAITLKEGFVIIVLSWILSFIFGMLPYALWGGPFNVINAWFESVSGFTTSGATILTDIEALPKGLLFWRASTHFIGGLGVVVFLLLIIPDSSPVRMRLTNMELSSLSKGGYLARSNRTVYIFAYVFLALNLLAFLCYWIAGMNAFDAICHAFSVGATGGFSTKNASIAAFGSRPIELISMVFMLLGSLHFGLLFLAVAGAGLKPLRNPVLRFYLWSLVIVAFLNAVSMHVSGAQASFSKAIWESSFQTLSAATTTGFSIIDPGRWAPLPPLLLFTVGVFCGCAGSTSGGVKVDRLLIFIKSVGRQIGKTLHPSSVNEVRFGGRVLNDDEVTPHLLYIGLYIFIAVVSVLLLAATGLDSRSAIVSSISSLGNLGPGSYTEMTSWAKFLCSFEMFMGRIEIYPVLAVVAMAFDYRKRR